VSDIEKVAQAAREVVDLAEEMLGWADSIGTSFDAETVGQGFVNIAQSFMVFAESLEAIAAEQVAA
jgi:hypothetical protein